MKYDRSNIGSCRKICYYRIELRVGNECMAVGVGLVIESAALDFMPGSRDEVSWRIMLRVLTNFLDENGSYLQWHLTISYRGN